MNKKTFVIVSLLFCLCFAACGGGSGSDSVVSAIIPTPATADADEAELHDLINILYEKFDTLDAKHTTLQANHNDLETAQETQGETITAQGVTIAAQGVTITTQGETITALQEENTTQGGTITAQGETITAQGETITALQDDLQPLQDDYDSIVRASDITCPDEIMGGWTGKLEGTPLTGPDDSHWTITVTFGNSGIPAKCVGDIVITRSYDGDLLDDGYGVYFKGDGVISFGNIYDPIGSWVNVKVSADGTTMTGISLLSHTDLKYLYDTKTYTMPHTNFTLTKD